MPGKIPEAEADAFSHGGINTGNKLTILISRKVATSRFGDRGKAYILIFRIIREWYVIC